MTHPTDPTRPERPTQATLRTTRLLLVPLADEHLEDEVALDADPEVMRYLGDGRARTREAAEAAHRRRLAAAGRVPGLGFWAGLLAADAGLLAADAGGLTDDAGGAGGIAGEFVGWWILEPPQRPDQVRDGSPPERHAELGYRVRRRFWRRGLASEGARELIRHGFADLGLRRIFAETMAVNTASRATMASVGLRHVRTFHQQWEEPLPGAEHGEVEYELTRDEWLAGRAGGAAG